jgi:hypothetical protein
VTRCGVLRVSVVLKYSKCRPECSGGMKSAAIVVSYLMMQYQLQRLDRETMNVMIASWE